MLVRQLFDDYKTADISDFDMIMLDHAVKLTKRSNSIKPSDIAYMQENGFSDRNILDVNQVTAYFAYVNRVASGLGVELEESTKEKLILHK